MKNQPNEDEILSLLQSGAYSSAILKVQLEKLKKSYLINQTDFSV